MVLEVVEHDQNLESLRHIIPNATVDLLQTLLELSKPDESSVQKLLLAAQAQKLVHSPVDFSDGNLAGRILQFVADLQLRIGAHEPLDKLALVRPLQEHPIYISGATHGTKEQAEKQVELIRELFKSFDKKYPVLMIVEQGLAPNIPFSIVGIVDYVHKKTGISYAEADALCDRTLRYDERNLFTAYLEQEWENSNNNQGPRVHRFLNVVPDIASVPPGLTLKHFEYEFALRAGVRAFAKEGWKIQILFEKPPIEALYDFLRVEGITKIINTTLEEHRLQDAVLYNTNAIGYRSLVSVRRDYALVDLFQAKECQLEGSQRVLCIGGNHVDRLVGINPNLKAIPKVDLILILYPKY